MKLISTYIRLAIKVDQIGTSCTNVYDLAGRMVEKQYHTGATPALGGVVTAGASLESTDTFTFDRASRVIATRKGRYNIRTQHSYALDSQPLTETIIANREVYTSSRTYDAANRPLSHTFPNGKTTQWSYTARNLVSTLRYEDELIATNTYDAGFRQTNQNYGNGLKRVITYARQDNLRSTDRVLTKDDLNFNYTYAVDKQVTSESIVADQVENTSFTASYDAGNRLTAWNRAGADENHSQTWNYDNAGNWNSTTKDGDTESRDHSVSDQITQLDGKAVSHDLKGNLTDYEYDRTDYRVKYDLDNRIVEVKADSETIRYRYDALGRRIVSKGDDETVLIWWGDSECAEYEHRASKDAIQNDIMGHPTRLNSVIARDTEDRENRVELQWYHKNYLDHVYAVSDKDGDIKEHYRYTAFGEPEIYSATGARRNTSAIGNTVMWNTRRYDADNGLYYYKYRHYAANIGRWLGRDPIEEDGGLNLYGFVGNEPIGRWDKFGLEMRKYERNLDLDIIDNRLKPKVKIPQVGGLDVLGTTLPFFPKKVATCNGCTLKLRGSIFIIMKLYKNGTDKLGNGVYGHELVHVRIDSGNWDGFVDKYNPYDGTVFDLIDTCEEWRDEINEALLAMQKAADAENAAFDKRAGSTPRP